MTEQGLGLLRKCIEDPTAAPKLVYADWLLDHGQDALAHAYRWCARRGRHPWVTPVRGYASWGTPLRGQRKAVYPHQLPRDVFAMVKGGSKHSGPPSRRYKDFAAAMRDLAATLERLRRAWEVDA